MSKGVHAWCERMHVDVGKAGINLVDALTVWALLYLSFFVCVTFALLFVTMQPHCNLSTCQQDTLRPLETLQCCEQQGFTMHTTQQVESSSAN